MNEDRTVATLHGTTDARVWAQEWCRIATEIRDRDDEIIDEGWMIGWFANAIEIGRDAGRREATGQPYTDGELARDPAALTAALEAVELQHMPGCADPDHRPATSLCTTEPYRTGLPWTSA